MSKHSENGKLTSFSIYIVLKYATRNASEKLMTKLTKNTGYEFLAN